MLGSAASASRCSKRRLFFGCGARNRVLGLGSTVALTTSLIGSPTLAFDTALAPVVSHPTAQQFDHSTSNWGGYIASGDGFKVMSASWINPTVDCSVPNIASFWVGFDGWRDSRTVEQIGLDANCRSGELHYQTWYQTYPDPSVYLPELVAEPGDRMNAQVYRIGGNSFGLRIEDMTAGWSKVVPVSLDREVRHSSVEVVVEPIGTSTDLAPLPNFSSVTFTDATVDGVPMDQLSPHRSVLSRGDQQLADTGPISNGAFAVTWEHS